MSYGLGDFIKDLVDNNVNITDEIYGYLSCTNIQRLKNWLYRLEKVRQVSIVGNSKASKAKKGKQAQLVGKIFEQLIRVMLDGCKALRHDGNIRSTISEIDFRIIIDPQGACVPMLRSHGTHAIGEAKFTQKGIKTEWLTELSGLLSTHNASLAILFTSSPSKVLATNHRHALSLLAAKDHKIVPIGMAQVQQVVQGQSFLKVLSDQYVKVSTHSSDLRI